MTLLRLAFLGCAMVVAFLSVPAFAESVVIPANEDVTVHVTEPHLLTPMAAARKALAKAHEADELAAKLKECAADRQRQSEDAAPTSWGLIVSTHASALILGALIGVWGASR